MNLPINMDGPSASLQTSSEEPGSDTEAPVFEYTAQATSPLVNGEVKLRINKNGLMATTLFDVVEVPYAEVNALELADYNVIVRADSGTYVFSRMGSWCEPFYTALCDAYNSAVLRSLFISGKPTITSKCDYRYTEGRFSGSGLAPVHVYGNNVTALPPDLGARRVPLCFVRAMDKGDYELTLSLDTGETYSYARMGYDTAPVEAAIEKNIRALREKTLTAVKEIDLSLTTTQASQLAKLTPEGAAAPFGQLAAIAPSFTKALEKKIAATRAADSYKVFKELCDPTQIWVGFRRIEAAKDGDGDADGTAGALGGMLGGLAGGLAGGLGSGLAGAGGLIANLANSLGGSLGGGGLGDGGLGGGGLGEGSSSDGAANNEEAPLPSDPFLLWMIAPSPDGRLAVVEFAEANSATFVYRTGGDFAAFARQLNKALEAISFKREVIRLSYDELRKPENAIYYMAAKRTVALQFVRANFVGRIVHSSPETWKRNLVDHFQR